MEPKRYLLDEITPDTKNWTAKVSIVNKTEPRTSSQPSSIRFQKLLLADKKEYRVEGIVYRGDIELLKNSLRPHQTYLISNAVVRPVKPGFENPLTNNKYQWILGARTAILATDEDALTSSELAPTFTQSDHFRDFLGIRTLISLHLSNSTQYLSFDEFLIIILRLSDVIRGSRIGQCGYILYQ